VPSTGLTIPPSPAAAHAGVAAAVASGRAAVVLAAVLVVVLTPVLGATIVLTWHGLRGTRPGPAAGHLLKLVELVTFPGRRR